MASIILKTIINAPLNVVFNLARSIDLHQESVAHTNEKAIAGTTRGLIELNEAVTWQARHLFKTRLFTSRITAMEKYEYFKDEMQQGDFKHFSHQHFFERKENCTLMIDKVHLQSPYGFLGQCVDVLFMKRYIRNLLAKRNTFINICAETEAWKKILNHT